MNHPTSPQNNQFKEPKRHIFGMGLSLSILIHAALLAMIGGVVIIQQNIPQTPFSRIEGYTGQDSTKLDVIDEISEELSDPSASDLPNDTLEMPEPMGGSNSLTDASLPELVSVAESSNFLLPSVTVPSLNIGLTGGTGTGTGTSSATGTGGPSLPKGLATIFGKSDASDTSLRGVLYDFKRDDKGKEQKVQYYDLLREFLKKDWSPNVLKDTYEVPNRLYANQILMPRMEADAAPESFQVADQMKPSQWMVHYQGSIQAPKTGRYRFLGLADDVLGVAINGKTVLLTGAKKAFITEFMELDTVAYGAGHERVEGGTWIDLDETTPVRVDILVGEVPGGTFLAWLMWEREGMRLEKNAKGVPIYPLFQMEQEKELPKGYSAPYDLSREVWSVRK
ncbi:MAG: hypothetical protein HC904_09015 [Blastochloris sp.]|nr:hypothetical protein [Blastochloris sp.]